MERIILALIFLLTPAQLWAFGVMMGSDSVVAGGGPDTWYYSQSNTYTSHYGYPTTWVAGDTITATVGGTITRIEAKFYAGQSQSVKIGLYEDDEENGTWTLVDTVIISSPGTGWTTGIADLSTTYTVATGEAVRITLIADGASYDIETTASGGYFHTGTTYAGEFQTTMPSVTNDYGVAVRAYVD